MLPCYLATPLTPDCRGTSTQNTCNLFVLFQSKKNAPNLTLNIVGEVIENLMGDSYHSIYLRDPRYITPPEVTNKSRKISYPMILGTLFLKDTQFSN